MLLLLTALVPPHDAKPELIAEVEVAREHIARLLYMYIHRWRDSSSNPGLVGKELHEGLHLADVASEEVFICQSQRLRLS